MAGAVVAFAATASAVPPVGAPADCRAAAPPEAGDVRLRGGGRGRVAVQEQGPLRLRQRTVTPVVVVVVVVAVTRRGPGFPCGRRPGTGRGRAPRQRGTNGPPPGPTGPCRPCADTAMVGHAGPAVGAGHLGVAGRAVGRPGTDTTRAGCHAHRTSGRSPDRLVGTGAVTAPRRGRRVGPPSPSSCRPPTAPPPRPRHRGRSRSTVVRCRTRPVRYGPGADLLPGSPARVSCPGRPSGVASSAWSGRRPLGPGRPAARRPVLPPPSWADLLSRSSSVHPERPFVRIRVDLYATSSSTVVSTG